jgi:hypothetical protein
VQIGADGDEPFAGVMTINRPDDLDDIAIWASEHASEG